MQGGASNLTVGSLFAALSEVFSKRGVVPRILSKFWARDQEVGKTLVAYSHSLMGILEEIAKADPGEVPDQSALLLKKFCAGVADQNLRRELKQELRSVPGSTFLDLRATALRNSALVAAPQLFIYIIPSIPPHPLLLSKTLFKTAFRL